MTMSMAVQASADEIASETEEQSETHHIAVVIHAGSAAAGVDANTGQVLFMHLRQAVESALVVLADSCSKGGSGILISVVIVLSVNSRVRCRCVLFQKQGLNPSSISIIDEALLEAQSDLCSMISEAPNQNKDYRRGTLRDIVKAGLLSTPSYGGEILIITEEECGGGSDLDLSESFLIGSLARKHVRLSAVVGMGYSGIGQMRDYAILKFISRASGGVVCNVNDVGTLRELFGKFRPPPQAPLWSTECNYGTTVQSRLTDESEIEFTNNVRDIRVIQAKDGDSYPWSGRPSHTALLKETMLWYTVNVNAVPRLISRRLEDGFTLTDGEFLEERVVHFLNIDNTSDTPNVTTEELILPYKLHTYIIYRIHRGGQFELGGKALVQISLCCKFQLLRLLRPRPLVQTAERHLLSSMSEKVTVTLERLNTLFASLQKSDEIICKLCGIEQADVQSISTVIFNNGIDKTLWHTIFEVRMVHAIRPEAASTSTKALVAAMEASRSWASAELADGCHLRLTQESAMSKYSFNLLSFDERSCDAAFSALRQAGFLVLDSESATPDLLALSAPREPLVSDVTILDVAGDEELTGTFYGARIQRFNFPDIESAKGFVTAATRSRRLAKFVALTEESLLLDRKVRLFSALNGRGGCVYSVKISDTPSPRVSCSLRLNPSLNDEEAIQAVKSVQEEDCALALSHILIARLQRKSTKLIASLHVTAPDEPYSIQKLTENDDTAWIFDSTWPMEQLQLKMPSGLDARREMKNILLKALSEENRLHLEALSSAVAASFAVVFPEKASVVIVAVEGLDTLSQHAPTESTEPDQETTDTDQAYFHLRYTVVTKPLAWISPKQGKSATGFALHGATLRSFDLHPERRFLVFRVTGDSGAILADKSLDLNFLSPIVEHHKSLHQEAFVRAVSSALRRGWKYSVTDVRTALRMCTFGRIELQTKRFAPQLTKKTDLSIYRDVTRKLLQDLTESSQLFRQSHSAESAVYCFVGSSGGNLLEAQDCDVDGSMNPVDFDEAPPLFLKLESNTRLWVYRGPGERSRRQQEEQLQDLIYVLRSAATDMAFLRDGCRVLNLSAKSFVIFEEFYESFRGWLINLGLSEEQRRGVSSNVFIDTRPDHAKLSLYLKEDAGRQWNLSLWVWTEAGRSLLQEDSTQRTALCALLGAGSYTYDFEIRTAFKLLVSEDRAKITMGWSHLERLYARTSLPTSRHSVLTAKEMEVSLSDALRSCHSSLEMILTRLTSNATSRNMTGIVLDDTKSRRTRLFVNADVAVSDGSTHGFVAVKMVPVKASKSMMSVHILAGTLPPENALYTSQGLDHVRGLRETQTLLRRNAEEMVNRMIEDAVSGLIRDRLWLELFVQLRGDPSDGYEAKVERLRTLVVTREVTADYFDGQDISMPTADEDGGSTLAMVNWIELENTNFRSTTLHRSDGTASVFLRERRFAHLALIELVPSVNSSPAKLHLWAKNKSSKCKAAALQTITSFINILCVYFWKLETD